jgi:hypothetical protein
MKVVENGRTLDATFKLEPGNPEVMLVFESRSGKRGTPSARNSDYERGLEVLLARLQRAGIHLKAVRLHPANGVEGSPLEIGRFGPPVLLRTTDDVHEVRLAMTRAQQETDRRRGARGGGNPTKRLRMYLSVDAATTDIARVERQLAGAENLDDAGGVSARPALEDALEVVAEASAPTRARTGGQGFGLTQPEKQAVEKRAMDLAREHFERLGWRVTDMSNGNCYDLACRKDGVELRVEVKGTTGDGSSVFLTRNEVQHARERFPNIALIVVSGIRLARGANPTAAGGMKTVHHPWRIDDGALSPVEFEYAVSSDSSSTR